MVSEAKLLRTFSYVEPQKLGFGLLVACFMVSAAYISITKSYESPLSNIISRLSSIEEARINPVIGVSMSSRSSSEEEELENAKMEKNQVIRLHESNSTSKALPPIQDSRNETEVEEKILVLNSPKSSEVEMKSDAKVANNFTSNTVTATREDARSELVMKQEMKPICDASDPRADVCEIDGDVRLLGKSSSLIMFENSQRNESWFIRPYARKQDRRAMANVREVSLKGSDNHQELPHCTVNHTAPAIVFSTGGYTGNFFHDFADVLVPLFLTSRHYNGEVHFLITNMRSWWIHKYLPVFKSLSKYEIIDFDNDDRVHCFPRVTVGLRCHKELSIVPSRSAATGYSMVNFTTFLREAYSLPREAPTNFTKSSKTKPRLLIIARNHTRKFANINKIITMAKKLRYEVVVAEASSKVADFASMVNSCDVMMGVHGAGLTNLVFLPTNAVFIQVVPWGGLDWISRTYFKEPAMDMKLQYLEYRISEEESTLISQYPRDHPVFKDPLSIHKQGWGVLGEIFLVKQDVKLDVSKFRPVLVKALKLLQRS